MDKHSDFIKITGLDFNVLSTLDHPYVSPPIRLLDSHRILYELNSDNRVAILNWDVSQPNNRTYRYDMQIDLAIIGRREDYFLFKEGRPYATQQSANTNLIEYEKLFLTILSLMVESHTINRQSADSIIDNYKQLKNIVIDNIIDSDGRLVQDYTKKILVSMNSLLSRNNIADFIDQNYIYYFRSPLMTKWIPYCIEMTTGDRSIDQLVYHDIFGRKIFRSLNEEYRDDQLNSIDFITSNKDKIASLIRNSEIIPSIEILYWSLEIAGVYHFGNDYGFFERYSKHLSIELPNQLTKMHDDGDNYFEIDKDYGMIYDPLKNSVSEKTLSSEVKRSRINSVYSIYLLMGDSMKSISQPNHRYGTVISIDKSNESTLS